MTAAISKCFKSNDVHFFSVMHIVFDILFNYITATSLQLFFPPLPFPVFCGDSNKIHSQIQILVNVK